MQWSSFPLVPPLFSVVTHHRSQEPGLHDSLISRKVNTYVSGNRLISIASQQTSPSTLHFQWRETKSGSTNNSLADDSFFFLKNVAFAGQPFLKAASVSCFKPLKNVSKALLDGSDENSIQFSVLFPAVVSWCLNLVWKEPASSNAYQFASCSAYRLPAGNWFFIKQLSCLWAAWACSLGYFPHTQKVQPAIFHAFL